MNRQRVILAVLLVALALAVAYSVIRFPRQKTVDKLTFAPGSVAAKPKTASSAGQETKLRLDLLQKNQVPFSGFRRNIFSPIFRDPSKQMPSRPVLPPPPPAPPPPIPVRPVTPPDHESNAVQRDMAQFTFLGFLEKDRKKTIFLGKDREIFLVKKGERIAGRYEAVTITDEALTIKVLGSGSEIIIPLVENRALMTPPRR